MHHQSIVLGQSPPSCCSSFGSLEQSASAFSFASSSPESLASSSSPADAIANKSDVFSVSSSSVHCSSTNDGPQQQTVPPPPSSLPIFTSICQSPLLIANPCYQSPLLQQRAAVVNNGISPPSNYQKSQPFTTSTIVDPHLQPKQQQQQMSADQNQQFRSHISTIPSPQLTQQITQHKQPTPFFNKRTISMQTVGSEYYYPMVDGALIRPTAYRNASSMFSISSNQNLYMNSYLFTDSLNVTIVDLLNEVSLSRLTRLYGQYSSDLITGSNRWYKRVQMVKNVRNVIRQVKDKAHLSFAGASTSTMDVSFANSLYGMSLASIQARTSDASPLPRFVYDMMHWLTKQAECSDGIFRKNGVKVRIQEIKEMCSRLDANHPIPDNLLTDSQLHDVADALKQYFRELPECLMTDRISEIIESMVAELPEEKHFVALRYCVPLLPSEHRDALLILLRFLNGITRHAPTNQMTSGCVATCWMPTLFHFTHFTIPTDNGASSRRMRRKTIGMPNEKERKAYESVKRILTTMIDQWELLLYLPNNLAKEIRNSKLEVCHDLEMAMKNGQFDFSEEIERQFKQQLFRLKEDYLSAWKIWELQRVFPDGSQLFARTTNDMIPLKTFRVQTSIAASPNLILASIIHNRHLWDSQVEECRRVGPSGQNFDILKVKYRALLNNESKKFTFLARRWRYSEFDSDGIGLLVERSVVPRFIDVASRAVYQTQYLERVSIYKSEFLVVPVCPGHSYLSYISRADFRGKTSDWYDKVYSEMLVYHLQCLKKHIHRCQNGFQGTIV